MRYRPRRKHATVLTSSSSSYRNDNRAIIIVVLQPCGRALRAGGPFWGTLPKRHENVSSTIGGIYGVPTMCPPRSTIVVVVAVREDAEEESEDSITSALNEESQRSRPE
ncbi:hypothetical protein Trydic_g12681 [Trypoxylus dichotomus]